MYKVKVYTASLVNKRTNNYRNVLQRELHCTSVDEIDLSKLMNSFVSKVTIEQL